MSTHNVFSLRNKKDISIFQMKKVPYLLLGNGAWRLHKFKGVPLFGLLIMLQP